MRTQSHAIRTGLLAMLCFIGHAALAASPASPASPASHHHGEAGHFPRETDSQPSAYVDSAPPLWDNLGDLSYKITTSVPKAQQYFDQGLRLAYAFNHLEAQRAFRQAQTLDPQCALCFWGEALVLGPNINAPMDAAAVTPAWAAIAQAMTLAPSASKKEQGLIAALAQRYADKPPSDRHSLDEAYATAMGKLAARFPEDSQIAVLYTESLMDLAPWDYWEDAGRKPKGRTADILAVLERVLTQHPNHPGAIHYYIHLVEASDRPERAEAYADRLAALVPGAGHLVHMPGHLYYRLGRYGDALQANRAAIAVDEAYLKQTGARGIYAQGYYPHNVHFLLVSAQMAGDAETALTAAPKLAAVIDDETLRTLPWTQPIKAAQYFAHAQFSSPDSILKLADPGPTFPYVQAMWRYARGVAAAAQGSHGEARDELGALTEISRSADFSGLSAAGIPGTEIVHIAREVLTARIAQAHGALDDATVAFAKAAALQEKLPYMEPPYWYYPVRRSLGAISFQKGDLAAAERELQASLRQAPNDVWTLHGLIQVLRKRGRPDEAAAAEQRLSAARTAGSIPPDMSRL